jgi:Right handed beta helix region
MTYPLPTRTTADSAQSHVDDHNTIHGILGVSSGLPTGLTIGATGHLANQNRLHRIVNTILSQSLPTAVVAGNTGHVTHHNTVHALLNDNAFGIRGAHGPQTNQANLPGYPGSFDGTIGSGGTWSSFTAFNSAGGGVTNGKYKVMGTHTSPPAVTVKAGQQFWGDPANPATCTFASGTAPMFTDGGSAKANVKIMNISFVGFRSTITGADSGGWEIGYCDIASENGVVGGSAALNFQGSTVSPRVWIHHCKLHNTNNPIWVYQSTIGALLEDCEIYSITTNTNDGGWKVATAASNITLEHCWVHDVYQATVTTSAGIWFDFANFNCIVEWCLVEDNSDAGIMWEANGGPYGSEAVNIGTGNICRYNLFRNNGHNGIRIHGSSGMEIYGNILYRNQPLAQTGNNDAEFQFYVNSHMMGPRSNNDQASDLSHNNVYDNYIDVTPTIGGHQPKRGVSLQVQTGTYLPSATPWSSNTKLNNFYDNYYDFNRALSSTDLMYWAGTNKTWSQWQALPQDTTSGAEA